MNRDDALCTIAPMSVSICVVAYNEEIYLPMLLKDIEQQTYQHSLIQIVLIDSISTDGTLKTMEEFKKNVSGDFSSVIIAQNPKKIQATGWNVAISLSSKDVIVRIDAHARIPSDFVAKNIECLKNGEYISGGIRKCLAVSDTPWQKLLLEAENSAFGSGINICRRANAKTYVKTMFHAAYKKEVFQIAGIFNENLLRTEDNEMHYRIRSAGYKFCLNPDIISYQYMRNTLLRMIRQKYCNGYWIGKTLGVCPGCISIFHLVPAAFVVGVLVTTFCTFLGLQWPSLILWVSYCALALLMTLTSMYKNSFHIIMLLMPFVFLVIHLSYGLGTVLGIISNKGVIKNENS